MPNVKRGKNKSKKIRGVHIHTGNVIEYASMAEAFRKDKFHQSSISRCYNGTLVHYKKYKWFFVN